MAARWAPAAAALLLLAGCADTAAPDGPAPETAALTVRGVVVDGAIRPLEGARVELSDASGAVGNATTAADGAFAFTVAAPGAHFLKASKAGFLEARQPVDVPSSGEAEAVRLVLPADPLAAPAIQAFAFQGFIECSVTAVAARLAACSVPDDLVLGPVCQETGQCVDNLTNDAFLAVHDVAPGNVQFIQSEMVWASTQSLGERMRAITGVQTDPSGAYQDLQPYEGPSPLVMATNGTIARALGVGDGRAYQVRVFASEADGTALPTCLPNPVGCPWGAGLVLQQEFEIFTHVFFGFRPQAGWQFSVDGEHPLPPA